LPIVEALPAGAPPRSAATGPDVEPLLLSPSDVALSLAISVRSLWALHSRGGLPRPVRLPGVRGAKWSVAELGDWVKSGCPERSKWESMRDKT